MKDKILIIGGANWDIRGRTSARYIPHTSNPGVIERFAGGVGRNVAENLARLETPVELITAVGDDREGAELLQVTHEAGVDVSRSLVLAKRRTGKYVALLTPSGELVGAVADMGVVEELTPGQILPLLEHGSRPSLIFLDANLPTGVLETVIQFAKEQSIPVGADPVSVVKGDKLRPMLPRLTFLTPNRQEVLALARMEDSKAVADAARNLCEAGISWLAVKAGADGASWVTKEESVSFPAKKCRVVDVTGAGDALSAGLLAGLWRGFKPQEALRLGMACAALTVLSPYTVSPEMGLKRAIEWMEVER